MKKCIFASAAIIAVLAITSGLYAQPGGGGMGGGPGGGGMGGGPGGGMMGGGMMGGGMMGGGMMGGGMMGGMGMGPMLTERPAKDKRLAAVKELDKQVAALKAAVEKAPTTDPNMSKLEGADLTKFMDTYTVESNAINTIQATLTSLRGTPAGMGGMMMGFGGMGGPSQEVLTELSALAKGENATKTTARIDALIKEAQDNAARMQEMMGGMGGGFGGF